MARRAWIAICALALAGVLAAPAGAAFPGVNGRIVVASSSGPSPGLQTIDDLSLVAHTLVAGDGSRPAWSPDGTRVAFVNGANAIQIVDQAGNRTTVLEWGNTVGEIDWSPAGDKLVADLLTCDADNYDCRPDIYTMNLDGSDLTNLTPEPLIDKGPAWSPLGDKIVFSSTRDNATDLYTIAPDGTDLTNLTSELPGSYFDPDWSPDASRLVAIEDTSTWHLVTMDPDGGARVPVSGVGAPMRPAWSPDGTHIAYETGEYGGLVTVRPDGTDQRQPATAFPYYARAPDWQPLHLLPTGSGYPRPKHASPIRVSLVPAYRECGSGNPPQFTHGPPLAYPSCADRQSSEILMPGSRKSTGRVRLDVRRGIRGNLTDEADVDVSVHITDVSCQSMGYFCAAEEAGPLDYIGEAQASIPVRITDKFNGAAASDASATTMEVPLNFAVPCLATTDTTIGSTCSVTTSADAALPGSVPEGKRSVWELGQIVIYDRAFYWPGFERPVFMRQGVFVP